MIQMPIFKPHYHVEVLNGEGVLILTEQGDYRLLHGKLYENIAELILANRYTSDSMVDLMSEDYPAPEVYYALLEMEKKGYIFDSSELKNKPETAFWLALKEEPTFLNNTQAVQKISLVMPGNLNFQTKTFIDSLNSEGVSLTENDEPSALQIIITNDYLGTDLKLYFEQATDRQTPYLLLKPNGIEPWIGPYFKPGESGCFHCFRLRLTGNKYIESFIHHRNQSKNSLQFNDCFINVSLRLVYEQATIEILRILRNNHGLHNKILTMDLDRRTTKLHHFVPSPSCIYCGKINKALLKVPPLKNQITISGDTGYRSVLPEKTIKKYQHLIDPIVGVVTHLKSIGEDNLFVYTAGYNKALLNNYQIFLKWHIRDSSAGKGLKKSQAKASALCEALERYSGAYQGNEYSIIESYHSLGAKAIHPNDCMLYSKAQYHEKKKWEKLGYFCRVPRPFDPEAKIHWSPVWSVLQNTYLYLPTEFLYYFNPNNSDLSRVLSPMYCYADSNGNASGNNLEEAILQGFFELVERDAVALWWYNCLKKPEVSLESFEDALIINLKNKYTEKNREIWVLDITSDLGIPTFVACSRKLNENPEKIIFGFGCHLNAKIAIIRALTEMNQVMLLFPDNMISIYEQDIECVSKWLKIATLKNQPYFLPTSISKKEMRDYPVLTSNNLLVDLEYCKNLIKNKKMDFLIHDQTRPEVGLSVVKIIVPGLRHFWTRFAKGRLYDVPVEMGWLTKPLLESELNPIPMFM